MNRHEKDRFRYELGRIQKRANRHAPNSLDRFCLDENNSNNDRIARLQNFYGSE